MATSDVEIANMALGHMGTRATIADLTENSVEAREISRWYEPVRDGMLRGADWNFARVYVALSLTGTPPAKWAYSYGYPSDCLRFRGFDVMPTTMWPTGLCTTFEVGSDGSRPLIWCNLTEATGIYTQRVTSPSRFEPEFTDAFALALAAMTCLAITNRRDLAQSLKMEAKQFIEDAQADSANEQLTNERERVSESLSIRGYDAYDPYAWPWNWPNV